MAREDSLELQRHFDGIADAYYGIVDRTWYDVGYYHQREAEFLRKNLPPSLNLAVDAGCGPGRHSATLSQSAHRVVAIDMSLNMLRNARLMIAKNDRGRVDLIQADVRHLPLRAKSADLVLNLEVLEHLPGLEGDMESALAEFARVLRPSGLLITEAPLHRHTWWRHLHVKAASFKETPGDQIDKYYVRNPLSVDHPFKEEAIDRVLARLGFLSESKLFVRFFPSGLVERHPAFRFLDQYIERVPLLRRLCREAIWCMRSAFARSGAGP